MIHLRHHGKATVQNANRLKYKFAAFGIPKFVEFASVCRKADSTDTSVACKLKQTAKRRPVQPPSRVNGVGTTGKNAINLKCGHRYPFLSILHMGCLSFDGVVSVIQPTHNIFPGPNTATTSPTLLNGIVFARKARGCPMRRFKGPQAVGSYDARNSVVPTTGMPSRRYLMPLSAIRKPLLAPIECLWERRRL